MKNKFSVLFLAIILSISASAFAQKNKKDTGGGLSKAETKEWEKKKKEMSAAKYKEMYEEYNTMKGETAGLKRQIEALQRQASNNESMLSSKDQEIAAIKDELAKVKEDCSKDVTSKPINGDDYTKGVVYKVQVGAFRNKDLSKFTEKGNFWTEDADGVKKYTIGYFRDYWEADTFKKYLREMGVKDAWIVAYENDQRRDIKEVMEQGGKDGSGTPAEGEQPKRKRR
jgi:hypothetical protein